MASLTGHWQPAVRDRQACFGRGISGSRAHQAVVARAIGDRGQRRLVAPWRLLLIVIALALLASGGALLAQRPADRQTSPQLSRMIAGGQLAEAEQLARQLPDPQARSHWLGQVASGYLESQHYTQATRAASAIPDDRQRAGMMKQVAGARGGGVQADFDSLII